MPTLPKQLLKKNLDLRQSTVIAIASGIGGAAGFGLLPWYTIFIPLLALPFLKRRHQIAGMIFLLIALLSGILHSCADSRSRNTLPDRTSLISGTLRCVDRRISAVPILPEPKLVNCEITSGDLSITLPAILPQKTFYGDTFAFSGILEVPKVAGLLCSNGEITGELPPLYGDRPRLIVKELLPQKADFSLLRQIFRLRDHLIRHLISGITPRETAAMTATLFFGTAGGFSRELNENFITSGTIHLFSVSGLHVTLAAGFILLILSPLPFKSRHYAAAFFTLLYVLLSGASLPAIRAGSMVIFWCILRANLINAAAWNALMYTWSVFMIISPATAGSISAQYSFGITAILLLLSDRIDRIFSPLHARFAAMNSRSKFVRKEKRFLRRLRMFVSTIFAPVAAFAGSCGISLYRQNSFSAGSIPANLMIIFITPLLFGAMFFKLIPGALFPWCDHAGAFFLEGLFQLLIEITRNVTRIFYSFTAAAPPLWSVIVFQLLFFCGLGIKSIKISAFCLAASFLMIFCWQHSFFQPEPFLLAINSDSSRPPLLAIGVPSDSRALIINVPDGETGALAGKILRSKGIKDVKVVLSNTTDATSSGLLRLAGYLHTQVTFHPGKRPPSRRFHRNLRHEFIQLDSLPPPGKFTILPDGRQKYRTFSNYEFSFKNEDKGRSVEIKTPAGKQFTEILPWTSLPALWMEEL